MSRPFERQVNELHIRAAILNRLTELGRPQTAGVWGNSPQTGLMQQRPFVPTLSTALPHAFGLNSQRLRIKKAREFRAFLFSQ